MEISLETQEFVRQIDDFSHHKLTYRAEVATLIELARWKKEEHRISEIAFLAKFLSNAYGILKRSSPETQGYEKLTKEFQENLDKAVQELRGLLENATAETRERFSSRFLSMTAEGFGNLMTLLYDLSWVKNWYLDHEAKV